MVMFILYYLYSNIRLVTRAAGNDNYPKVYVTRKKMKKAQVQAAKAGNKPLAKQWKKAQLPYKKMLNALSGAMKDKQITTLSGWFHSPLRVGERAIISGVNGFSILTSPILTILEVSNDSIVFETENTIYHLVHTPET